MFVNLDVWDFSLGQLPISVQVFWPSRTLSNELGWDLVAGRPACTTLQLFHRSLSAVKVCVSVTHWCQK